MKTTSVLRLSAALSISLALFGLSTALADDKAPAALTGQVISEAEGAMEGVVVTAHKDGSIVSVSVTTDARGRYAFPENKLARASTRSRSAQWVTTLVRRPRQRSWPRRLQQRISNQENAQSRQPAQQRRMDDEHPRHRGAESDAARLHGLPYAGACRALDA